MRDKNSEVILPDIYQGSVFNKPKVSLSHEYFEYAKNQLKTGSLNPDNFNFSKKPYQNIEQDFSGYDIQNFPYKDFRLRDGIVYKIANNINSSSYPEYDLPNNYNYNSIKEAQNIGDLEDVEGEIKNQSKRKKDKANPYEKRLYDQLNRKNYDLSLRNKKRWDFIKSTIHLVNLFKVLRKYAKAKVKFKQDKIIKVQSTKQNLIELREFAIPFIDRIIDNCLDLFYVKLKYDPLADDKEDNQKTEFAVRFFLQEFYSHITSIFANSEDIPPGIKKSFQLFLDNHSQIPYKFLSVFEYNRLEFDSSLRLINMNKERKGLLVCFILIYRIVVCDLLKNHFKYFSRLKNMKPKRSIIESRFSQRINEKLNKNKKIKETTIIENTNKNIKVYKNNSDKRRVEMKGLNNYGNKINKDADEDDDDDDIENSTSMSKKMKSYKSGYKIPPPNPPKENNSKKKKSKKKKNNTSTNESNKKNKSKKPKNNSFISSSSKSESPPKVKKKKTNKSGKSTSKSKSKSNSKKLKSSEKVNSQSKIKKATSKKGNKNNENNNNNISVVSKNNTSNKKKNIIDDENLKDNKNPSIQENILDDEEKLRIIIDEEEKLKKTITYNFYFLINIFHYILTKSFENYLPVYEEDFKNRFCRNLFVYENDDIVLDPDNDDFDKERSDGVHLLPDNVLKLLPAKQFIKCNYRWLNMYIYNNFQFCCDFGKKVFQSG